MRVVCQQQGKESFRLCGGCGKQPHWRCVDIIFGTFHSRTIREQPGRLSAIQSCLTIRSFTNNSWLIIHEINSWLNIVLPSTAGIGPFAALESCIGLYIIRKRPVIRDCTEMTACVRQMNNRLFVISYLLPEKLSAHYQSRWPIFRRAPNLLSYPFTFRRFRQVSFAIKHGHTFLTLLSINTSTRCLQQGIYVWDEIPLVLNRAVGLPWEWGNSSHCCKDKSCVGLGKNISLLGRQGKPQPWEFRKGDGAELDRFVTRSDVFTLVNSSIASSCGNSFLNTAMG